MAAPIFREVATDGGVSTSSLAATFVTAAAAGELLLALVEWQDASLPSLLTAPSGWSLLAESHVTTLGTSYHVASYWRRATAGLTGLSLAFFAPVSYPRLVLLAYTVPAGAAVVATAQGGESGNRQNAAAGVGYGAITATPTRDNALLAYFVAFAGATTVALASNPTNAATLRATVDVAWCFEGAQSTAAGRDVALTFPATTSGVKIWSALAVELWCTPFAGLRPTGAFRPSRVYEDPTTIVRG